MATSRDELFCKLAIRQGAWTQDEARLFLQHYRSDGQGQRFGEWAAQQGSIDAGLAARIENAINKRNEGTVDDNRKRLPSKGSQATKGSQGSGSGAATTHKRASKRLRRGAGGSGLDFNRRPVQSSIFVACGVISIVLLFFISYQFLKEEAVAPVTPEVTDSSKDSKKSGSSATAAANATEKAPVFSTAELKAMANRIQITIVDARGYLRDGKTPIGLKQLNKVREELGGDRLPDELKGKIDTEITEIESIIQDIYSELLEELAKARAASDSDEVENLLSQIGSACGSDFRTLAEKEGS